MYRMTNKSDTENYKTYFVTAKVEIVYEVFAKTEEDAAERFEAALDDEGERASIFEDASSLYEIDKIEDADTHLGNSK